MNKLLYQTFEINWSSLNSKTNQNLIEHIYECIFEENILDTICRFDEMNRKTTMIVAILLYISFNAKNTFVIYFDRIKYEKRH